MSNMSDTINNVRNLDSIIFYSGLHGDDAAETLASRQYGTAVDGVGTLRKTNDGKGSYYSEYPSIIYKERNLEYSTIGELYEDALSYVQTVSESDTIDNAYISNNQYNIIYTYETDLHNDFDNANDYALRDLSEFLIGLNTQKFNKTAQYGNTFEVSSVKIHQTYFTWYPENTTAYYNAVDVAYTYTYFYYFASDSTTDITNYEDVPVSEFRMSYDTLVSNLGADEYVHAYRDAYCFASDDAVDSITYEDVQNDEVLAASYNTISRTLPTGKYIHSYDYTYYYADDNSENVLDEALIPLSEHQKQYNEIAANLTELQYIHTQDDSYIGFITEYIPYKIGGNYYSYIRQAYTTIDSPDSVLAEHINSKLDDFKESHGNDPAVYAYYMYECNADQQLMLTTKSFGVKNSTFKIGFTSLFDNWFGDTIKIHGNFDAGDAIIKVTSGIDDSIFSLFINDETLLPNQELDKDESGIFTTDTALTADDTIEILTPYSIGGIDLGSSKTKLSGVLDLTESGWNSRRCLLTSFILDDGTDTKSTVTKILGLNELTTLEYVDISNVNALTHTPAIDKLSSLKVFKANGSNIDSFRPAPDAELYEVDLPETVKSIKLVRNKFVPGEVVVGGELKQFSGDFNYTPNDVLASLTLRNIDNEMSYSMVTEWYDKLEAANKLNSTIYLELLGIDWKNIPVSTLINLRKFDLNSNLSGIISVVGSGNYKMITRSEYQDILKKYGLAAFIVGNIVNNKTYRNLDILLAKPVEDFEFTLTLNNKSIEARNLAVDELEGEEKILAFKYKDTLVAKINGYEYDSNGNETIISPIYNRAANALLDMIYSGEQTEFNFIKDELDAYAYCKLSRSIDTSASNEVKNINAGDILLFNGDTLMIFFEDTINTNYEYIKLGNIVDDETVTNSVYQEQYSLPNWFSYPGENGTTIKFIKAEREMVVDNLAISADKTELSNDDDDETVTITLTIPADVQAAIEDNKIANPNIIVGISSTEVVLEDLGSHKYKIDFSLLGKSVDVEIFAYAEAAEEETKVSTTVHYTRIDRFDVVTDIILPVAGLEIVDDTIIIPDTVSTEYDPETFTLTINN